MEARYDIYIGVDVGKFTHHITALSENGGILIDRKVDNSECEIEGVLRKVLDHHGTCLLVVDQPGNLASLVFAVADKLGIERGFITPKAMRKATELFGLYTRTDAVEAGVIAEISARIPELVITVRERSALLEELAVLLSNDRSLTTDITRATNRLHDLLLCVHPALERTLSRAGIQTKVPLLLLERYGGPRGLTKAGQTRVKKWLERQKGCKRQALALTDDVFAALFEQTVCLLEARSIDEFISASARHLSQMLAQRRLLAKRRGEILSLIPEDSILQTMPGLGVITSATILTEIGNINDFASAACLASYAGFAPTVKQSGRSIFSSSKPRGGNRRLKRVLYLSAERSTHWCDESREYLEKKRSEGKSYKAAITALARKRIDVMYVMLTEMTPYKRKNGK